MSYTYYNSSAASMGAYMKYRARLGIDTSDGTESTAIIKWVGAAQSTQISGWGIKIAVSSSGDTSGYSGSKSGSDTGVVSSSTDFETDAKTSGTLKISRGHSSKSVTIKATVSGTTVNGHTGVTAGSKSVSHEISIRALDSYTIKYNFNGGEGTCDNQTKWYGETLTLREGGQLTRSGYKIVSWNTTSSGSGTSYQLGGSYTKNAGDTLYAIWEPRTYTISFNSNGGSSISTTIKVIYNSTYGNMPTPTRTGYTFAGWYTSSTGGTKITSLTKVTIAGNDTLYAHWTINSYTLTYQPTGGTVSPASKTLTYGAAYGDLPTPARTGYTFTGWYTSETGGSQVSSSTTMGAGNRTIFAHWTIKSYTLTFDANGGTVDPNSRMVNYNSQYGELPTPIRKGYTSNGWFTASAGGSRVSSSTIMGTKDVTIYAQWSIAHAIPVIGMIRAYRADETGKRDDGGTYLNISFNWDIPQEGCTIKQITIEAKEKDASTYTEIYNLADIDPTEDIDNPFVIEGLRFGSNNFDINTYYNLKITIVDSGDVVQTKTSFLSPAFFTMDILKGGHGIAFGAPAETEEFKVAMPANFTNGLTVNEIGINGQPYLTITLSLSSDKLIELDNSYIDLCNLSLTPGLWVIRGWTSFNGSTAGVRDLLLTTNSTVSDSITAARGNIDNYAGDNVQITSEVVLIENITANTTYYLKAKSRTGSPKIRYARMDALKIFNPQILTNS